MLGSAEISQSHVAGSLGPQETTGVKLNRSQGGGFGQLTHCQKPRNFYSEISIWQASENDLIILFLYRKMA